MFKTFSKIVKKYQTYSAQQLIKIGFSTLLTDFSTNTCTIFYYKNKRKWDFKQTNTLYYCYYNLFIILFRRVKIINKSCI
jgi:hypothetical protein